MLAVGPEIVLAASAAFAGLRVAVLHRRVRDLEREVIRDPLTGAFNRRHMQVMLSAAIERRRRAGERASLLLIDLDRFKEVNDRFGHAEGDRVLKELVAVLNHRLRKVDALFRLGGEEFALLLSGASVAAAIAVAEELRRLVQDAALTPGQRLSVSIGVVEMTPGQSAADWVAAADAALYRAKRSGRNRVSTRSGLSPVERIRPAAPYMG